MPFFDFREGDQFRMEEELRLIVLQTRKRRRSPNGSSRRLFRHDQTHSRRIRRPVEKTSMRKRIERIYDDERGHYELILMGWDGETANPWRHPSHRYHRRQDMGSARRHGIRGGQTISSKPACRKRNIVSGLSLARQTPLYWIRDGLIGEALALNLEPRLNRQMDGTSLFTSLCSCKKRSPLRNSTFLVESYHNVGFRTVATVEYRRLARWRDSTSSGGATTLRKERHQSSL